MAAHLLGLFVTCYARQHLHRFMKLNRNSKVGKKADTIYGVA